MKFHFEVGYAIDGMITVDVDVQAESTSESGLYLKLFFAGNTDRSTDSVKFQVMEPVPSDIRVPPVVIERRYELPDNAATRVEFDATAGGSGYPMTVAVSDSRVGKNWDAAFLTNETQAITLE